MRNLWISPIGLSVAYLILTSAISFAGGQYGPGVSDTEIKIGNTMAYSGPASSYGTIGKSEAAYFAMINEQGGRPEDQFHQPR
jgi:branched-chain amino acid transport system substrate-binding protein